METIPLPAVQLGPILPEIIMTALVCLVILVDLFLSPSRKGFVGFLTLVGLVVTGIFLARMVGQDTRAFGGMYRVDDFSTFFKFIFLGVTFLTVLISFRYLKIEEINLGEYYSLLLFSTIGMMIMASGNDLLTIYIGLELLSIPVYILVGFLKRDLASQEGGIKYFLLGIFSSAIVLYGIALIYGYTGTIYLDGIREALGKTSSSSPLLTLSIILLTAGFAFKVALVPFHMWAPDAYQGAPTTITAFMSVGTKAAAFAALVRVFMVGLGRSQDEWTILLWLLAVVTMTWGNMGALVQSNLKRLLAYSSIAHAGYILIGLVVATRTGIASIMLYMAAYLFTNLGAFALNRSPLQAEHAGRQPGGLPRFRPGASLARPGFGDLLPQLDGNPADRGFRGQVLPLCGGDRCRVRLAGHHRGAEQRDIALLLLPRRDADVHGRTDGPDSDVEFLLLDGRHRGDGDRRPVHRAVSPSLLQRRPDLRGRTPERSPRRRLGPLASVV